MSRKQEIGPLTHSKDGSKALSKHTIFGQEGILGLRDKEETMNLAVCVEPNSNPTQKQSYKIWYLELDQRGKVVGIGVKTKEELIQSVLENFRKTGKTNWRCFQKESEKSHEIEVFDFIAMNSLENTHFGDLPTLSEFQSTLDALQSNFELQSIA